MNSILLRFIVYALRTLLLLTLLAFLLGCNFALRGTLQLPKELTPVGVEALPGSHLAVAMHQILDNQVIPNTHDAKHAGIRIRIYEERHDNRVTVVNRQGKTLGGALLYRASFDAISSAGQLFLERQTLESSREYVNPDLEVLGKAEEAELLRADMEHDVAGRILARLRARLLANSTGH